jgi:hypothetical protein
MLLSDDCAGLSTDPNRKWILALSGLDAKNSAPDLLNSIFAAPNSILRRQAMPVCDL